MNSQGSPAEIGGLPAGEDLDHVLEINESVVHRRSGEQEKRLAVGDVKELPVVRTALARLALNARIPEMVGLVDYKNVCHLFDSLYAVGKVPAAQEIGVVQDHQIAELTEQVWQPFAKNSFPNCFAPRLWYKKGDAFSLPLDEIFNQHESDKGFPQTNAITQERTPVLLGDFYKFVKSVFLVLVQYRVD